MSNVVSVFDSMFSNFFPRVYRRPWVVQQCCDAGDCSVTSAQQCCDIENCCSSYFPKLRTNENEYAFEVDVPGVEKDDLVTELDRDILTIYTKHDDSEKDTKSQERKRMYHFQFKVPDDIDAAHLKASLKNGVLTVTLPKSEEKKPIKVPVMIE